MSLIGRFFQTAALNGQRIAVEDRVERLSYEALARRVEDHPTLAAPGERVLLALPRGVDFVVRLLAAWNQGVVPVPLDPQIPQARRHEIETLACRTGLESEIPAYAIATSGSSGRPKLVEVLWEGVLPMLEAQIESFALGPGHRVLWMLSPGFDASLSDVLTTLLAGATLCCATPDAAATLPRVLSQRRITHLDMPPALLDVYRPGDFPNSLQTLVVGGAPSDPEVLRAWSRGLRLVAVYGPTEATICSSLSVVDQSWDAPYLGQPIGGLTYRVEDGELCIGGPGVARGYAGLESSSFWIEDGQRWYRTGDLVRESSSHHGLIFAGRRDRQIQHRGQRIEPEEIEARLRPLLGSGVAVVPVLGGLAVFWEHPFGDETATVPSCSHDQNCLEKAAGPEEQARRRLREFLPTAWMPQSWHRLERLPRLANGKVNLAALKTPPSGFDDDSLEMVRKAVLLERSGLADAGTLVQNRGRSMSTAELAVLAEQMLDQRPVRARLTPLEPRPSASFGKPRLLVTGASGQLGRALLPSLSKDYSLLLLQHKSPCPGGFGEVTRGDLTLPFLGLEQERWQALEVDAVLHLAASLEVTASLEQSLAVNASPLLTLAQLGVPIHLASTLSVVLSVTSPPPALGDFEPVGKSTLETEPLEHHVLGSYAQSKWVAERLHRELKCGGVVLRYGLLLGEPRPRELLSLTIQGLLELGCYPVEGHWLAMDFTPIELAVQQTLKALRSRDGGTHAISSRVRVLLGDVVRELAALGHSLRAIGTREFFSRRPATAAGVVAQLAMGRLRSDGEGRPEWDLFLMSDSQWKHPRGRRKVTELRAAMRKYVQAVTLCTGASIPYDAPTSALLRLVAQGHQHQPT